MKKILFMIMVMMMGIGYTYAQTYDSTTLSSRDITTTTTLNSGTIYILKGFVYVTNGASLVIPAGTVILGDKATTGTLIIERGGKIIANGSASQPILFTSRIAPGPSSQRGPGDWGGIIMLGRARINTVSGADTSLIEGLPLTTRQAFYGGNDDNDSSGVLRYVRIEFPGINLTSTSGNEINGLTMGGIGRRTQIEYVQVSYSGDDAFEWFGGTVNCRYLIAYKTVDDDFDTDNGYRGMNQFLLAVRDSNIADVSASHGWESDNNANSPNNYRTPRTQPIYSNVTFVGPKRTSSTPVNPNHKRAAHLRRNTLTSIYNSIIMADPVGILFDGVGIANAANGDTLQLKNNIFASFSKTGDTASMSGNGFNGTNFLMTSSFNNRYFGSVDSVGIANPYGHHAGLWTLNSNSPANNGASFSHQNLQNAFFQQVNYVGAFGNTNWTLYWSDFNPLQTPIGIQQISSEIPAGFSLFQNYPNPFNPVTKIRFNIPNTSGSTYFTELTVYNSIGQFVETLISTNLSAGTYEADWNASGFSSGIYFYKIKAVTNNGRTEWLETRKMTLVK